VFNSRRFGTLCLFHLYKSFGVKELITKVGNVQSGRDRNVSTDTWQLVADPLGSGQHTLETTGLSKTLSVGLRLFPEVLKTRFSITYGQAL
jgi:hypothetical protein